MKTPYGAFINNELLYCSVCEKDTNHIVVVVDRNTKTIFFTLCESCEKTEIRKWHKNNKEATMAKWNYVEVCGNLVEAPKKNEKATFVKVALWQDKQDKEKEYKATFLDIAFFGKGKEKIDGLTLDKGTPVTITGILSNKENKEGHTLIAITGRNIEVIEKNKTEETTEEAK